MRVKESIVIDAPADTVYQIWRNFENFPEFMNNIEEVYDTGDSRSHWKSKGPLGQQAEWDAEVTEDDPGHAIGWRSLEGSKVETSGRVLFADQGGSTELQVELAYEAPGGALGAIATQLLANPDKQIKEDLKRFKEAAERGREFSGFNYYMPKRSGERPDAMGENTAPPNTSNDATGASGVAAKTDPAIREAKGSTATGTPGGLAGTGADDLG